MFSHTTVYLQTTCVALAQLFKRSRFRSVYGIRGRDVDVAAIRLQTFVTVDSIPKSPTVIVYSRQSFHTEQLLACILNTCEILENDTLKRCLQAYLSQGKRCPSLVERSHWSIAWVQIRPIFVSVCWNVLKLVNVGLCRCSGNILILYQGDM